MHDTKKIDLTYFTKIRLVILINITFPKIRWPFD